MSKLPKKVRELRTEEELKQLARDAFGGQIFFGRDEESLQAFFPMVLMNDKQRKSFLKEKPAMIFEYLEKAGPMSVNGYPRFFSMQFMNDEEATKFEGYYKKLQEALK